MQPAHILIVDDHPDIRSVLEILLSRSGYEVCTAATGPAAIEAFESACPDLMLLDINLPGMSGIDVCRIIKAQSAVPIILITGNCEAEITARREAHGADLVIGKPFDFGVLTKEIRGMVQSRAACG